MTTTAISTKLLLSPLRTKRSSRADEQVARRVRGMTGLKGIQLGRSRRGWALKLPSMYMVLALCGLVVLGVAYVNGLQLPQLNLDLSGLRIEVKTVRVSSQTDDVYVWVEAPLVKRLLTRQVAAPVVEPWDSYDALIDGTLEVPWLTGPIH